MIKYPVVEKFVSINGEGVRAGELAVFIRFRKCNLNCSYCDTKWANSDDVIAEYLTSEQLTDYVLSTHIKNVTLTGGEPLLQTDINQLIESLIKINCRVEIETNGSVSIKELSQMPFRPIFTMDYKLPSSGMEDNMIIENFSYLRSNDTVKFVAGSMDDLSRGAEIIKKYNLTQRCHIYFSSVFGNITPMQIVDFMKERNLNDVRLQLQLHKYIWSPDKQGV